MDMVLAYLGLGGIGPTEMIIVGMIALLLFGKRLPEVARSMGKGVTEFKKGLRGIEEDVEQATYTRSSSNTSRPLPADEQDEVTAPKFEPPQSEPVATREQQV